jgi:hypothetical protein
MDREEGQRTDWREGKRLLSGVAGGVRGGPVQGERVEWNEGGKGDASGGRCMCR